MKAFTIELHESELLIHHPFGIRRVRRDDILSVETYTGSVGVRCFGYGGIQKKWGWYYTKELGLHRVYVSLSSSMLLLKRKDGHPIVFSCDHADELLAKLH